MADKYIQYRTQGVQRWSDVAWQCYADFNRVFDLVQANPSLPCVDVLPSGTLLVVPVFDTDTETETNTALLPPWKR